MKKFLCLILSTVLFLSMLCIGANAAEVKNPLEKGAKIKISLDGPTIGPLAFDWDDWGDNPPPFMYWIDTNLFEYEKKNYTSPTYIYEEIKDNYVEYLRGQIIFDFSSEINLPLTYEEYLSSEVKWYTDSYDIYDVMEALESCGVTIPSTLDTDEDIYIMYEVYFRNFYATKGTLISNYKLIKRKEVLNYFNWGDTTLENYHKAIDVINNTNSVEEIELAVKNTRWNTNYGSFEELLIAEYEKNLDYYRGLLELDDTATPEEIIEAYEAWYNERLKDSFNGNMPTENTTDDELVYWYFQQSYIDYSYYHDSEINEEILNGSAQGLLDELSKMGAFDSNKNHFTYDWEDYYIDIPSNRTENVEIEMEFSETVEEVTVNGNPLEIGRYSYYSYGNVTLEKLFEGDIIEIVTKNSFGTLTYTFEVRLTDPVYYYGDVNLDDDFNIADVTTLQKYLAYMEEFNETQLALADFNLDDDIDIADCTAMQKELAGIEWW